MIFLNEIGYKWLWLCILLGSEVMLFKEISATSISNVKNDMEGCKQCKTLTDSFNYWLKKTSRGKYEGGDAAWEEAKLKTYSRSEVRLVEIQEGLCSELKTNQDQCYSLADEAETNLEKWYYTENHNTVDLYTWLCIENLQYCCPTSFYGESCLPCPSNSNGEICSGHGQCHGDGTRGGNGTCVCIKGYTGKNCDECAAKFYSANNYCRPCHKACDACVGGNLSHCITCSDGWEMHSNICTDINECAFPMVCQNDEYCENKEGSFTCEKCYDSCRTCTGPKRKDCSSCREKYIHISGLCLTETEKNTVVEEAHRRFAVYFGLLLSFKIIFRTSKSFGVLIALFSLLYIYYTENTSDVYLLDVYMQTS